jgi:alginate O-acetyltransferase complex protein AlgI
MYHRDRHHPTLPQEMAVAPVGLEAAVMVLLLILCTAYLVDGSFSPFLYFRF